MAYGMYISAEGAQAQAQRLEVIANNLANVETPGFKRDVPSFQARFAEAIQQGDAAPGDESINDLGGGVKLINTQTDYSSTSLRHTKVPTDFAIQGEGFFQLRTDEGETLLSRAGNFYLDPQGRLLSKSENLPVLDDGGAPIQIDGSLPWTLLPGGIIDQDGSTTSIGLAHARIARRSGQSRKQRLPFARTDPGRVAVRDIRQGYLEQSGVNPTRETMAMIETTRAYEANMKLVQHQDSMMSGLINRVLGQS